jgi:hypothetical protein
MMAQLAPPPQTQQQQSKDSRLFDEDLLMKLRNELGPELYGLVKFKESVFEDVSFAKILG